MPCVPIPTVLSCANAQGIALVSTANVCSQIVFIADATSYLRTGYLLVFWRKWDKQKSVWSHFIAGPKLAGSKFAFVI
jgi:hypothetical protein